MPDLRDLHAQREEKLGRLKSIHETAVKEERGFTEAENAEWASVTAEVDSLAQSIDEETRQADRLRYLAEYDRIQSKADDSYKSTVEDPATDKAYGAELRSWLMDERASKEMKFSFPSPLEVAEQEAETRAQSVGSDSGGGHLTDPKFSGMVEVALKQFNPFLDGLATVFTTDTGSDFDWPTVNDTSNKGAILAENTAATEKDVAFGNITFKAYKYSSKLIRVSEELLQDSEIDVPSLLARILGERIGRITSQHFLTGSGSSEPTGLLNSFQNSDWITTADEGTLPAIDHFNALIDSVDPGYQGNATFMLGRHILTYLRNLKDKQDRPLLAFNYIDKFPTMIDGTRVVVHEDWPGKTEWDSLTPADTSASAISSAVKVAVYGDISKHHIRRVRDFSLFRFDELYRASGQIGFHGVARMDCKFLNAGTGPVKGLAVSATDDS